ncbi:glutamine amidotransferase [Microbacterium candidum]|uniref:Lipid II isoglutaminyl synthase (glutamine-hydrolyzing) subunit GatD n=1 Tax=Microbacterium candidum TaxID=3041922 RepID=A0ABT7MZ41_9MICO|nr:glutamine amidotransferase [Microbacterium sp. ASV49]MDL9979702.1 glutamine amidotransferase [Microbacterium sp. ASV49]
MTALRIVQLYPVLLGVTGDRGNVDVLAQRARRAGLDVTIDSVSPGDDLPDADIIVLGNGPLSALRSVVDDLRDREPALRAHLERGGVILAIGGGAELLGSRIGVLDGDDLDGIGLLPYRVDRSRDRRVGYIVAEAPEGRIVGFEDHASVYRLADGAGPYAQVTAGKGGVPYADGRAGEGVRVRNAFALNVQGPLLPLNAWFADLLLAEAASAAGLSYERSGELDLVDGYADGARAAIEERATKHFTAIDL